VATEIQAESERHLATMTVEDDDRNSDLVLQRHRYPTSDSH